MSFYINSQRKSIRLDNNNLKKKKNTRPIDEIDKNEFISFSKKENDKNLIIFTFLYSMIFGYFYCWVINEIIIPYLKN